MSEFKNKLIRFYNVVTVENIEWGTILKVIIKELPRILGVIVHLFIFYYSIMFATFGMDSALKFIVYICTLFSLLIVLLRFILKKKNVKFIVFSFLLHIYLAYILLILLIN